jgi:hypothetical protein
VSQFEFVSVLISIIIAFALSEVLSGWGRLLRVRQRVAGYWVHNAWALLLVLLMVQFWWGLWQFRGVEPWTFLSFLGVLLPALNLVVLAFLVTPDVSGDQPLDLRAQFFQSKSWFFALGALLIAQLAVINTLIEAEPLLGVRNLYRLAAVALLAALARSESERFHALAVAAAWVLLVAFIAFTSPLLGS